MRILVVVAVSLLTCGLAFAPPPRPNLTAELSVGEGPGDIIVSVPPRPIDLPPPVVQDADRDGFAAAIDCNDRNPMVRPSAVEIANGIDDNCDGVVDDGFDTTIDWPTVVTSAVLWPDAAAGVVGEHVSMQIPPRLVWMGDGFAAIWVDVRNRLRTARFGLDGVLAAPPVTLHRPVSNLDAVWDGTRLAIVYEDRRIPQSPSVRLAILDREGIIQDDRVLVAIGSEPKIAWGQDRFGVVWRVPGDMPVARFQTFDAEGCAWSAEQVLDSSIGRAAITFDGTIVREIREGSFRVHDGMFGIVYEARGCENETENLFLVAFPREESGVAVGPVRVNANDIPPGIAIPSIASNQSGFLVAWNTTESGQGRAMVRYHTHDTLAACEELAADADAGDYGRLIWTGSEFIMANDNQIDAAGTYDVHFRRLDGTGNSHVTSPLGAWTELELGKHVPGGVSVHPDVVRAGGVFGVLWVECDTDLAGTGGRLMFNVISHR